MLSGWDVLSNQLGEFIDIIPAQQRISADWYKGTADAIYQNLYAVYDCNPKLVLILAGDHVYKMNYQDMIMYHKKKKADMTVACIPMPKEHSVHFGVVEVDEENHIRGFQEKPQHPKTIPGNPCEIFASMGIYLFDRDVLISELESDAQSVSEHDFGKNVIPRMLQDGKKIYVYNFVDEHGRPRYWRDIGTRDAYYQANMDLLGADNTIDLHDRSWPVRTFHEQYPPIRVMSPKSGTGTIVDSMISGGCIIAGGHVERSILSPDVQIGDNASVKNSILMEGVMAGDGAKIQNAIIDKGVKIPPHAQIGYNLELDAQRFVLTTSGIVIVAKKTTVPL